MVALFSNIEDNLTVPVEILGMRIVGEQIIISDTTDELVLPHYLLGLDCTFTSMDVEDYVGTGISVFSFKRDYCNG